MQDILAWILFSTILGLVTSLENVALNKSAYQTGAWMRLSADKAVDGRYGFPGDQTYCAHPQNPTGQAARWWVDLQDTYRVQEVKIHNTYASVGYTRLTHFAVSVGSSLNNLVPCGPQYTETVGPGQSVSILCDQVGRFVQFERKGGPMTDLVTLCEVEVYARFYDCTKCLQGTSCSQISGCDLCPDGKIALVCVNDCADGYYGTNCTGVCGRCMTSGQCQPADGRCTGGCQLWWAGDRCQTEIKKPDRTGEVVSFIDVSNSSIEISWQQIRNLPQTHSMFYGYLVEYKKSDVTVYTAVPTPVPHTAADTNSLMITDLEYNTEYSVRVVPYREMSGSKDRGIPYPLISKRLMCGYPEVPEGVAVSIKNQGKITVSWKRISSLQSRCSSITEVRVEYRLTGDTAWSTESVDISATSHTLTPPGGGSYHVRLTVVNNENFTSSSATVNVEVQGETICVVQWAFLGTALGALLISISVHIWVYSKYVKKCSHTEEHLYQNEGATWGNKSDLKNNDQSTNHRNRGELVTVRDTRTDPGTSETMASSEYDAVTADNPQKADVYEEIKQEQRVAQNLYLELRT